MGFRKGCIFGLGDKQLEWVWLLEAVIIYEIALLRRIHLALGVRIPLHLQEKRRPRARDSRPYSDFIGIELQRCGS